jgi:ABC-2 type transport system permease protein
MTTALANSSQITARYLRAFLRQPYYIAGTLVQPIIWLLLFGQLFKRVAEIPGFTAGSYIAFLTPGIVVMSAMLSTGWSGTSYVIDMERGVMDRFLVTPVRRGALIGGELVYQAGMVLLQSLIILGLGYLAGARFEGGGAGIVILLVCTMLLGTAFASLSNTLALILRKQESVIAANVTLTLPLTFLSSTFLPVNLMPQWMQDFAAFNPVNWAVEAGRQTLNSSIDWSLVGVRLAELLALTLVCAWLSTRAFRAYQRSV